MAVVGAIQDGIAGDYSILAAKAVLDMIIVIIMTTSMGKGCIFSVIPVALFQGCITILSRFIEPWMTEQALANLSLTGSMLIFCVGVNLIWEKKFKICFPPLSLQSFGHCFPSGHNRIYNWREI